MDNQKDVDLFLELKDYDGKTVEGETLDTEFSKKKAIEIASFSLDGDSAESRDSGDEDEDDDDAEVDDQPRTKKRRKKKSKKSGPYCKFEITKTVDKSSTSLLLAYCWTLSSKEAVFGPKYASARITVRKGGGGQQKFLILTFEDVSVINYSLDVDTSLPEEKMTFKFEKLAMNYFPQSSDGKLGVMQDAKWDFHAAADS